MIAADLGHVVLRVLDRKIHLNDPKLRQRLSSLPPRLVGPGELAGIVSDVVAHVVLFGGQSALEILEELDAATGDVLALFPRNEIVPMLGEASVLEAREKAGVVAAKLGFRAIQRTKIVTATSELARNIHMYARQGEIRLEVLLAPAVGMKIRAEDRGPGIANVGDVLAGRWRSSRGMGLGLKGVRALADHFTLSTSAAGTFISATFHSSMVRAVPEPRAGLQPIH